MVETISPVVHGGDRKRYALSMFVHVAGATVTATLTGAVLGAIGRLAGAPWGYPSQLLLAVAALVWAGGGVGLPVPVPQGGRQVPEWWRTFYSPNTSALLYGVGLGFGFPFRLGYGTLAVVALGCISLGDPLVAAGCFGTFGLVRGLSIGAGARGDHATHRLDLFAQRRIVPALNALVLAGVAGTALI